MKAVLYIERVFKNHSLVVNLIYFPTTAYLSTEKKQKTFACIFFFHMIYLQVPEQSSFFVVTVYFFKSGERVCRESVKIPSECTVPFISLCFRMSLIVSGLALTSLQQ